MKINGIGNFTKLMDYVQTKVDSFSKGDKTMKQLYEYVFQQGDNVFAEFSNGYKIGKLTYRECKSQIQRIALALQAQLQGVSKHSLVGLYMVNSVEWIQLFWAILQCGYKPLLLNTRASDQVINDVIATHGVAAVVSDGKQFDCPTYLCADVVAQVTNLQIECCDWEDEVVFMSSGTTNKIKLCYYKGENLFWQVCDSVNIVKRCPKIATGCDGEIKLLALLPFYHVFGFIAVYLWFAFFSRTFVFLKDIHPQTLLNTVKRHKVTHIFAVPLVWETIHKTALKTIAMRGDKTWARFQKGLRLASKGKLGQRLVHKGFAEVREGIFGDSIRFLISGGSAIDKQTLAFFNAIGYTLSNGYGMTEIGITSFETDTCPKVLNTASIGVPFSYTQYKLVDKGELACRGKAMAHKIVAGDVVYVTNPDQFFNTGDFAEYKDGRYYLLGRKDDVIISSSGENINPDVAERLLQIDNCNQLCMFVDVNGNPTLLVSAPGCYSKQRYDKIVKDAHEQHTKARLAGEIRTVAVTTDVLMDASDFKI
ncbi:MAG: AMP-binding protein, partial [Clostridia bacterium]|nr:AMP-binding protein [Clostridia bacterium]